MTMCPDVHIYPPNCGERDQFGVFICINDGLLKVIRSGLQHWETADWVSSCSTSGCCTNLVVRVGGSADGQGDERQYAQRSQHTIDTHHAFSLTFCIPSIHKAVPSMEEIMKPITPDNNKFCTNFDCPCQTLYRPDSVLKTSRVHTEIEEGCHVWVLDGKLEERIGQMSEHNLGKAGDHEQKSWKALSEAVEIIENEVKLLENEPNRMKLVLQESLNKEVKDLDTEIGEIKGGCTSMIDLELNLSKTVDEDQGIEEEYRKTKIDDGDECVLSMVHLFSSWLEDCLSECVESEAVNNTKEKILKIPDNEWGSGTAKTRLLDQYFSLVQNLIRNRDVINTFYQLEGKSQDENMVIKDMMKHQGNKFVSEYEDIEEENLVEKGKKKNQEETMVNVKIKTFGLSNVGT